MSAALPLFITSNQHKADYLGRLLGLPLEHRKIELEEIQSTSLEEIATHKARQAYELLGVPVLVDDIGLSFSALNSLPGPFIKYFEQSPGGLELLCRMLDSFDDRSATASAAMAYFDGSQLRCFTGSAHGIIAAKPMGTGGHGWDAIFCPDGYSGKTRAELSGEDYAAVYGQIRPIAALRAFLESL